MVWAGFRHTCVHVCRALLWQLVGRDPDARFTVLLYGVCSHSEACASIEPTAWAFGGAAACFQCVSGWGASHPGPAADEDTFVLGSANPHGLPVPQ